MPSRLHSQSITSHLTTSHPTTSHPTSSPCILPLSLFQTGSSSQLMYTKGTPVLPAPTCLPLSNGDLNSQQLSLRGRWTEFQHSLIRYSHQGTQTANGRPNAVSVVCLEGCWTTVSLGPDRFCASKIFLRVYCKMDLLYNISLDTQ